MKEEIQLNLHNPAALEALYRKDRTVFRSAFQSLYPELAGRPLIEFWKERLFYREAAPKASATEVCAALFNSAASQRSSTSKL